VRAVHDYSIVIQEYVQARLLDFLENYAKEVFGIHHYYAMFEFAKSRGHIHVHILAMLGKKSNIIELNDLVYKERHDVEKQARVADDWMTNVFGLTAIHHGSSTGGVLDRTKIRKPEGTCETQLSHPVSQKLSQVTYHKLDLCNLCNCFKMHNCSGYCLYHQKRRTRKLDNNSSDVSKKRKSLNEIQPAISTAKRFCQFGAGHEEHVGIGDTPGFE
jgi:hypothetical protein